jgi:hypothetical protein
VPPVILSWFIDTTPLRELIAPPPRRWVANWISPGENGLAKGDGGENTERNTDNTRKRFHIKHDLIITYWWKEEGWG